MVVLMGEIKLTQGKVALVDNEDYGWLSQWKWNYSASYAKRIDYDYTNGWRNRIAKSMIMHRMVIDAPKDKLVDHINGNTLDNRKVNLRLADKSLNALNSKLRSDNTSGVTGVYKRINTYYVQITIKGKTMCLGSYKTFEEALNVRKEYDRSIHIKQF